MSIFSTLLRLTLQKKYSLSFSIIFIVLLGYIIMSLLKAEERDLIRMAEENYQTLFRTVNTMGAEALSVGESDRIALKSIVDEIFAQQPTGLISIEIINRKKQYFIYRHTEVTDQRIDQKLSDSLYAVLENASPRQVDGNLIVLTHKIMYKTANRDIFLGHSRLTFSVEPINLLIAQKRTATLTLGFFGFLFSLLIITLVTAFLIRRIKLLNKSTLEMMNGKYEHLPVKGTDELSELTRSFNHMMDAVKERLMMSKFVSGSTIDMIKGKSGTDLHLGGQKEDLCLFFSDIRGFTAFSEKNEPAVVVQHLNELLNMQVEIINHFSGDVDKFVGDEVMAAFRGQNKAKNAVLSAIEIQKKMQEMVKENPVFGDLRIGIGIHSGEVVTGNIGAHHRMDFTSIGDVVNTSARLCSAAGKDEILISERIKKQIPSVFKLSDPFQLPMKNKTEQLNLFRVQYES